MPRSDKHAACGHKHCARCPPWQAFSTPDREEMDEKESRAHSQKLSAMKRSSHKIKESRLLLQAEVEQTQSFMSEFDGSLVLELQNIHESRNQCNEARTIIARYRDGMGTTMTTRKSGLEDGSASSHRRSPSPSPGMEDNAEQEGDPSAAEEILNLSLGSWVSKELTSPLSETSEKFSTGPSAGQEPSPEKLSLEQP